MTRYIVCRMFGGKEEYLHVSQDGVLWFLQPSNECLWYTPPGDILSHWNGSYVREIHLTLGKKVG